MGQRVPSTPLYPTEAAAITASDADVFEASAIYVGTGGNVTVKTAGNQTVLFTNVLGGTVLPVMCIQVRATGTAGSGFVRIY